MHAKLGTVYYQSYTCERRPSELRWLEVRAGGDGSNQGGGIAAYMGGKRNIREERRHRACKAAIDQNPCGTNIDTSLSGTPRVPACVVTQTNLYI